MSIQLRVTITQEALNLFAPLRPCPECGRPLSEPLDGDYRHWEGCSAGERERETSEKVGEE